MNDQVTTLGHSAGYGISQEQRHKVLRNTYWLLALSMLPTVLGAWIGVATGITQSLSGGLGLIVFMGGAFGFMYAIEKTKNSAAGVPVLLAFTFFMGLMLSRMIGMVLGFKNGTDLIMTAFAGTAGVFFVMASLASVIKRDSIRPMKNVKASRTGTPAAEFLVFSMAYMKPKAPTMNTISPTPPRSDWVMPVATPSQAPSTVGSRLSASSQ